MCSGYARSAESYTVELFYIKAIQTTKNMNFSFGLEKKHIEIPSILILLSHLCADHLFSVTIGLFYFVCIVKYNVVMNIT